MSRSVALLLFAFLAVARTASPQGMPVGPEFLVNTYTTDSQRSPSISSDSSGNFVVVWVSNTQDGSGYGVFGQRYEGSGGPLGGEFLVNTYTTGYQLSPSVTSDSTGDFVVVWTSGTPDNDAFGQRFASSGVPLGGEFRVNTYTTNAQYNPSVTSDASGSFVVVWTSYTQDGSLSGIFGQRFDSAGASLGAEFRVNTHTTGYQLFPAVTSDPTGNFVVVWTDTAQDGSGTGVFGQRYSSSGMPLGSEFRVNTYTTNAQYGGSVASDSTGNFVVAWRSNTQDGPGYGVFGQRYASSGTPLGPEFRVNSYTTGGQDRPSVASDPSGNFVVVWHSFGQDGSGQGVIGQRYSPIVPVALMGFGVE